MGRRSQGVVALFGVAVSACLAAPELAPAPSAALDAQVHDFGEVRIGDPVMHVFTIKNEGDQPFTMKLDQKACGCTTAMSPGGTIEAGGTGWVEVSLDTSHAPGRGARTVTLKTSSPAKPEMVLVLKGNVVPDVSATPDRLFLGRLWPGMTVHRSVDVDVRDGISITRVRKDGRFKVRATRFAPPRRGVHLDVTLVVEPARGPFDDTIEITTSSDRQPTLVIPVLGLVQ